MLRPDQPLAIRLSDYAAPSYCVDHVDMRFVLDGMKTRVHAALAVRRNRDTRAHEPLTFEGDSLNADRVAVNGSLVAPESLIITPDSLTLLEPPADPFTLEIDTTLAPDLNTKLMGLYRTGGVYCT